MWFNNLQIYRFIKPFTLSFEELDEKLAKLSFKPCSSLQPASLGWVPPLGRHGVENIHAANGHVMICLKKEEKILPASVIRDMVAEKVDDIEAAESRPVRKKERDGIRDEITQSLLPKAFCRSQLTFAYISPKSNLLVINASSTKKAEELLHYLRKALGTLPVVAPILNDVISNTMTDWVKNMNAKNFVIEDEAEFRDPGDEGGVVRCKSHDLSVPEIQSHLDAGKQVVKLAVEWNESLSCIITDDLSIKRLKFGDEIIEQSNDSEADDYASRFDADFAVMTLELTRFIPELFDAFGGENEEAYKAKSLA